MKYMIFDRQHTTYDIRYTIYAEDLKDEVDLNHEQDHNNDDSLKLIRKGGQHFSNKS